LNRQGQVLATRLQSVPPRLDPLDGLSLPGWLYFDSEFFEAENRRFGHDLVFFEPGEDRSRLFEDARAMDKV
jgi:hypothetical protein